MGFLYRLYIFDALKNYEYIYPHRDIQKHKIKQKPMVQQFLLKVLLSKKERRWFLSEKTFA